MNKYLALLITTLCLHSNESIESAVIKQDSSITPPIEARESKQNLDSPTQDLAPQTTLERYFATNPAFDDKQNAIRFEFGASVRSNGFENQYQVLFIYSQPNRFFRLHGRLNVEVGGFFGFYDRGQDLGALNLAFAGVSEDILLPLFVGESSGNLYFGVGIGAYIKTKGESRVISNFTFGERAFVGYFWDCFSVEIFIKHFSNGTLATPNKGHNFFGLTSGYVF